MKNKSLFITIVFIIIAINSLAQETGTFTDARDGKTYKTVKIGTQTWMAENLAYKIDSGCWAYNNDTSNVKTYGYLYNWETAKNVCPAGWHLPTDDEWKTLEIYLGMSRSWAADTGWRGANQGGKLKETGIVHWESRNVGATNSSGFTALPGGYRYKDGTLGGIDIKNFGYWWSSTGGISGSAWGRGIYYRYRDVCRAIYNINDGFYIRCVKDK